jgi:FlaA1/EpsC-like NDP-sugar epimerase
MNTRAIVIGAGEAGRMLARELLRRGRRRDLVGFIDDNASLAGERPEGLPVLGGTDDVREILFQEKVGEVIIAMPSVSSRRLNDIVSSILSGHPSINIYILPSTERFFDRSPLSPALTDFEFLELLDREEYSIDLERIAERFRAKCVLVTGGGGSIGSELCRQLLKFDVGKIVALGRGEHSIYQLARNLNEYLDLLEEKPEVEYRIGNIVDPNLVNRVVRETAPDIVIHTAAHKHVPLMEYNPAEAVKNNVEGTLRVLEAVAGKVEQLVFISTDKAVRPTSVMGATKRMGELLTMGFHRRGELSASIIRFGNVLGSRGSVIPLFRDQILRGGPVTVTHPDICRYFMTLPEASLLVLNAVSLAKGGWIYALNMGEQYRLVDIARQMIRIYGYSEEEIPVIFTGLRPGEKMYEELFYEDDGFVPTEHDRIYRLDFGNSPVLDEAAVRRMISTTGGIYEMDGEEIRKTISELLPEYNVSDSGLENGRVVT